MAKSKATSTVEVRRADAVSLFQALGFGTAKKWDTDRLTKKLNAIEEGPDEALEDDDLDELLDGILASQKVVVIESGCEDDDAPEEKPKKKGKGKQKKAGKGKKGAGKKTAKKKKSGKEKKSGKDKFGNRNGSAAAKFNSCLSRKAKMMATLVDEAELTTTMYDHAKKLIERKLIEKTDKGYRLTK